MSPADARAAATRAFGNTLAVRERFHEANAPIRLEHFVQDLRYAARTMGRAPAFAIIATLCLAIGIGVNTAAFSVLNAMAFRQFPGVVDQEQLASVAIGVEERWGRTNLMGSSIPDLEMLRAGISAFSGIAASSPTQFSVRYGGDAEAVRGSAVSNNYFELLGTLPAAGRFMTRHDDPRELERVVVISHQFWERAFNARADIIGRAITIGTRSFSIIGVAPKGFFGIIPAEVIDPDFGAPELFVPLEAAVLLRTAADSTARANPAADVEDRWLLVFGRLRPGATIAQAQTQADQAAARLALAYPVERPKAFAVVRKGGDPSGASSEVITAMSLAMAVPAILLLVACVNLANQLVTRAVQRRREIALRLSLGATRSRVVRQLLTEAAVLALAGSAVGIVLVRWILDALRALVLPVPFQIAIDLRVIAFSIGLALLTAVAFGLAPALGATRADVSRALKDGGRGIGYRRSRTRSALVVVQIAASLTLIAASTVLVRAAQRPPSAWLDGLADRSLQVSVNLDLLGFDSTSGRAYQTAVMDRLGQLPGVRAVGMAPFAMFDMLGGYPVSDASRSASEPDYVDLAEVSGEWFEATNMMAVRGRLFSSAERVVRPTVAIVDEECARETWGDSGAVGRTLRLGTESTATFVTVVGVVPTRQEASFRQPEGVVFIPGTRRYIPRTHFYIRTRVPSGQMIEPVRQAVHALDPRVPILWVRTLEDVSATEVAPVTAVASGLAALGLVALALAALGLFGVLSFIVAQRRSEIGIRVALGARRVNVIWMVVREALGLGAGGVLAGGLLAVGAVTLMRVVVHGLEPLDMTMFGAMAATMILVSLAASALPAWRAASVDPMQSLRED
jgi:predicted permease